MPSPVPTNSAYAESACANAGCSGGIVWRGTCFDHVNSKMVSWEQKIVEGMLDNNPRWWTQNICEDLLTGALFCPEVCGNYGGCLLSVNAATLTLYEMEDYVNQEEKVGLLE